MTIKTPAVVFERVTKRYRVPHRRDRWGKGTLVSELVGRLRQSLLGGARDHDEVLALDDISFPLDDGEVVGVIGHNGAGKSTLLKVLTRITEPSAGRVLVKGHVTSLLEVGTGFHPELTGRENIFLYGAILGMDRPRVRARFDDIVAFADVSRFLDLPLKRWSSGMALRLGFAVASHLEHRVLVVDEALSVGDAAFRAQCLARIEAAARDEGRAVLFVSHDLAQIRRLASRSLLLAHGRLVEDGPTPQVLTHYLSQLAPPAPARHEASHLRAARLLDAVGAATNTVPAGAPCAIELELAVDAPVSIELDLETAWGLRVATLSRPALDSGVHRVRIGALTLGPGPYRLAVTLRSRSGFELDASPEALTFIVTPTAGRSDGLVSLELEP